MLLLATMISTHRAFTGLGGLRFTVTTPSATALVEVRGADGHVGRSDVVHSLNQYKQRRARTSLSASHSFNPFTSRNKNSRLKWFEVDLERFYSFVNDQPLLTAEQEHWCGKAVKLWIQVEKERDNLIVSRNVSSISREELAAYLGCSELTLAKMERYAELSKEKLVNGNLKLVLAVVSRYRTSGIPNTELIAEGTRGLAKAALRYDYSKGFRFATYATWYIPFIHNSYSILLLLSPRAS